jgi:hypothetical protein
VRPTLRELRAPLSKNKLAWSACNLFEFLWIVRMITIALLVTIPSGVAVSKDSSTFGAPLYSNAHLGFRYAPPSEMHDKTERSREEIKSRAESLHTANTLNLLLAMSSGPDDGASEWHSLSIETYPRKAIADLDDASAEAKMSALVAHGKDTNALPRAVLLSGQTFVVSVFGMQEGTTKKGAVVWTTVRKGKLLSFAFVANSPGQLKKLTESMKSVQFF